jgi:hypothetical protein
VKDLEILSTGEKIKRARIYKGFTLKDISGEKISVSKMSCIENDKIEAEDWILEYIGDKLKLDKEYLRLGIKEQLSNNLKTLENNRNSHSFEEDILYNISFAEKYKYYDLYFKFIHLLFNYQIEHGELEKVQLITSKYYEASQKAYNDENYLTYYMDIARFLYSSKDFEQAAVYYNNVRKNAKEKGKLTLLAKATYNEAACYIMLRNSERAYEIAVRLNELIDYIEGDIPKAEVYHMLGMLSLSLDKNKFEEYEKKSYELYKFNEQKKAKAIYNYATAMFDTGLNDKGLEYVKKALALFPKNNKEKLTGFMLLCVDELIDSNILDYSQEICDEALNLAINLDNIKFIERAYYLKSLILQKVDQMISAEMYMNLSLDALLKFGTTAQIYKRYLEMGHMYYKLQQTREAIKYLNLALNREKKM